MKQYKQIYSYPKNISLISGYGEYLPFKKHVFDIIFCSNMLDHTYVPEKVIKEIKRVLKINGFFILTVEIFEKKIVRDEGHPYCFRKDDILRLLGDKFKLIFITETKWIGLRAYTAGARKSDKKELILILQKKF